MRWNHARFHLVAFARTGDGCEVGHFLHHKRNLGSGHHDRNGVLLSSGMESLTFDRQLVGDLNAW